MKDVIVVIEYRNELIKLKSNKYKVYINISDNVIMSMKTFLQDDPFSNESGGVLIGYKVKGKKEIVINDLSLPDKNDESSIIRFIRKSISHIVKIKESSKIKSFCVGNWHTHPIEIPNPSLIDLNTWKEELFECNSSFGFQIFIICGLNGFKVWIGEEKTANITECLECKKIEGIYLKEDSDD